MQADPALAHFHADDERFVPGHGREFMPELVLVGEAPGRNEAAQGVPFVGAAGRVLDELLEEVGLVRKDIWITNVIKWRPPGNRTPTPAEVAAAKPYLRRELEALSVRRRVGVVLGASALRVLNEDWRISECAGKWLNMPGAWRWLAVKHPASALYNPRTRGTLSGQFAALRRVLQ
jgi:DNA polymerase